MLSGSKDKRGLIAVVWGCFFLSAFVSPISVYAAGEIVVAWGNNNVGECDVPLPNTGFMAIAAGGAHSLGLKQDGSIMAWGYNGYGESTVPSPNTGFMAIAASGNHSLGLKQDGSIVAWGYNGDGECNVPEPNTGFIAIAAGTDHSLGLKQDGSIVAWGRNYYGECNVPGPNTGFTAIAAGAFHSLGLKQDGSIVAWGRNDYGECDVPSPNSGFTAIAVGWSHSLGLKQDGSIAAWGWNSSGECKVPSPNTGFTAITAGWANSFGLKQDGSIVAWGDNYYSQRNVPSPNKGFTAIAAGGYHLLGLKFSITIARCTVTAGKTQGQDAFSASGAVVFPEDLDFNDVNHIDVNIISLTDGASIYTETVDSNVIKGKFKYTHKIPRGWAGAITSLAVDYGKSTFSISIQKVDLTGLACPMRLELTIGGPITGNHKLSGVANETIVNGPKTPIPIKLLMGVKNSLRVDKSKFTRNKNNGNIMRVAVSGGFSDKDVNDANLLTNPLDVNVGSQTFTVPTGNFKNTRGKFTCSNVNISNGIASAAFDFNKCTFTLTIKNTSFTAGPGTADFNIKFGDFNEVAEVLLP